MFKLYLKFLLFLLIPSAFYPQDIVTGEEGEKIVALDAKIIEADAVETEFPPDSDLPVPPPPLGFDGIYKWPAVPKIAATEENTDTLIAAEESTKNKDKTYEDAKKRKNKIRKDLAMKSNGKVLIWSENRGRCLKVAMNGVVPNIPSFYTNWSGEIIITERDPNWSEFLYVLLTNFILYSYSYDLYDDNVYFHNFRTWCEGYYNSWDKLDAKEFFKLPMVIVFLMLRNFSYALENTIVLPQMMYYLFAGKVRILDMRRS